MAGLMDLFNNEEGQFNLGLLAAAAPRTQRIGFGERMQDALGSVNAWKDRQDAVTLRKLQMDKAKADAEREARLRALPGKFMRPAVPASGGIGQFNDFLPPDLQVPRTGPMPAQPASFDFGGYAEALAAEDPAASLTMKAALQKDDAPVKLAPGEQLFSGKASGYKPLLSVPKPESLPAAVQEYNFAKQQGYTGTFQQWTMENNRSKAPKTDVRIENKMGEGIATQIGPMMRESLNAADGAAQTTDAAMRIVKAIDSGKILAGPLAPARLRMAQIGQMIGLTGKDEEEVVLRTREVIRGLAEMTLQGRKQMSGQGAITNNESQLAEDAVSGRFDNLGPKEIRMLAAASARAAKFIYDKHQRGLDAMKSNPNTAGMSVYYQPVPLPQFDFGAAPASPATSGLVDKWRSRPNGNGR